MSDRKTIMSFYKVEIITFFSLFAVELLLHLIFQLRLVDYYAPSDARSELTVFLTSLKKLPLNYNFAFGIVLGILLRKKSIRKVFIFLMAVWLLLNKMLFIIILSGKISSDLIDVFWITLRLSPIIYMPFSVGIILGYLVIFGSFDKDGNCKPGHIS